MMNEASRRQENNLLWALLQAKDLTGQLQAFTSFLHHHKDAKVGSKYPVRAKGPEALENLFAPFNGHRAMERWCTPCPCCLVHATMPKPALPPCCSTLRLFPFKSAPWGLRLTALACSVGFRKPSL